MTKIIDMMRADSPISGHSAEWYFFRSYIGAALALTTDDNDDSLSDTLDISDLSPETLEKALRDCAAFYAANRWHIHCDDAPLSNDDINLAARESSMAGHDFYLTRCGHGAGFWDGDWPEPAATILDKAAEKAGNVDFYIGDDGQIYSI